MVLLYAVHSTTPAFWASRSDVYDLLLVGDTRRTRPRKGDSLAQDGDFRILRPGAYVRCAVTGEPIPLDELRYWSVDLQEAYASPTASMKRQCESRS